MRIVRQRSPERFTVLDNEVIEDERLSFRELGLLAYLLSRPDGWKTDSRRLAAPAAREGRDAVQSSLRNIAVAGYLVREKVRDSAGRYVWQMTVVDTPQPENPAMDTTAGKPGPGKPAPDNQATLESTKTNHGHKEMFLVDSGNQPPPRTPADPQEEVPEDVHELAAELRTHRKAAGHNTARWTARAVSRAITAALAKGYSEADIPAALLSIALDPATQTPGRLPHDGPWWDDAEIRRRNAERAELERQRRTAERAAAEAAAHEDARRAADCWRCQGTSRTSLEVDGRTITAICTHGHTETESA